MATRTIGLLYPGAMGSTIGAAALAGGARVLWASDGRSRESAQRARDVGLEDAGDLENLTRASDVVLSVCPPDAAEAVARAVAHAGFAGLYVDANAVAPARAREIGTIVEDAGARFVDGSIIGPPAHVPGTTRLYLSGDAASLASTIFEGSRVEARVVAGPSGAASALKMAYAAWTKGTSALVLAVRALAAAEGVEQALLQEWGLSQPALPDRSESAARDNAGKAWRFVGEMEEIAATFAGNDLPDGFHLGAAEIYRRLARFKDANEAVDVGQVVEAVLSRGDPGRA